MDVVALGQAVEIAGVGAGLVDEEVGQVVHVGFVFAGDVQFYKLSWNFARVPETVHDAAWPQVPVARVNVVNMFAHQYG